MFEHSWQMPSKQHNASRPESFQYTKLLALVFKIEMARGPICLTRINPDRWERMDTQPHIGLMLVALNIAQ
jgi:hypothetical protein